MPWTYHLIKIIAIVFIVGTFFQLVYITYKRAMIRSALGKSYNRIPESKRLSVWQLGAVIFWSILGVATLLQLTVEPGVASRDSFFPYYFLIIISFSFVLIIIFKHNGFGGKRVLFYNDEGFLQIPEINARFNWFQIKFIRWDDIEFVRIRRREHYNGFWLINIDIPGQKMVHLFTMTPEKDTFIALMEEYGVRYAILRKTKYTIRN